MLNSMDRRIAPFDVEAAEQASTLMASRKLQGRLRDHRDTMIAGIVLARHATLATRNISHFDHIQAHLIDPWAA
jgi:predicted nucleic acid-binding protein